MNCLACRKPVNPRALTCGAKCRNAKKRVTAWLALVATEYKFSSQELAQLARFAYQHGIKLGRLASRALQATKEREGTYADPCAWCGEDTEGHGGERIYCSTACRVSACRLRARKGDKPDNWYEWLRNGLEAKEWLQRRAGKAWGIVQAIEWRYDFDAALSAALFCYENKGETVGLVWG